MVRHSKLHFYGQVSNLVGRVFKSSVSTRISWNISCPPPPMAAGGHAETCILLQTLWLWTRSCVLQKLLGMSWGSLPIQTEISLHLGAAPALSAGCWTLGALVIAESCQRWAGRALLGWLEQPEPAGDCLELCMQQMSVEHVRFSSASAIETRFCQKIPDQGQPYCSHGSAEVSNVCNLYQGVDASGK